MPEGDTIHRTAARLRAVVTGCRIHADRWRQAPDHPSPLAGRQVVDVEARGKHLLLHLDDGHTVHSHLGMTGAWHIYRPGQRWFKPERRAALVLEMDEVLIVCFSPKTLELLSGDALRRHAQLRRLGPDLLGPPLKPEEVLPRFRVHDPTPVGEAVMNQTIVCGVGNVYKSEVLYAERIDPFAAVAQLSDASLWRLVGQARRLMSRNLEGYPRRTRYAGEGRRLWVYGRAGEACYRCGTRIAVRRQGDLGRTTYWCPVCQGSPAASPDPSTRPGA